MPPIVTTSDEPIIVKVPKNARNLVLVSLGEDAHALTCENARKLALALLEACNLSESTP
jgi:hypothetical protein